MRLFILVSALLLSSTPVQACELHEAAGPAASAGPASGEEPVMCTQEAKICPDGTAVGRTGPNCEFAPCPGPVRSDVPPPPRPQPVER